MSTIRTSCAALAVMMTAGCIQDHLLGQVGSSVENADASESTDADSADSDEQTSTSTEEEGGSEDTGEESSEDTGETSEGNPGESETGETGETEPLPEPCEIIDLGGNSGVLLDITLMTQWDEGACHEFYVTNESGEDLIWNRELRFGGTVDNYWNAEGEELSPTDWRFGGQASASNIVVLAGQTIMFGSCMSCMP